MSKRPDSEPREPQIAHAMAHEQARFAAECNRQASRPYWLEAEAHESLDMIPILKTTRLRMCVDDQLLAEAMQLSGASNTRDVIEQSLKLLVRLKRLEKLRDARESTTGIDVVIDHRDDRF